MRGLKASLAPRRQQQQAAPKLEKFTFLPYQIEKVSKILSLVGFSFRAALYHAILQHVMHFFSLDYSWHRYATSAGCCCRYSHRKYPGCVEAENSRIGWRRTTRKPIRLQINGHR